jgi:hypothetical protein
LKTIKISIFSILVLSIPGALFSQDIIIKNDKSETKAKVIEIQETTIKYKLYDFLEGPLRNISVSDVFMIIYENGKRETFNTVPEIRPTQIQTQTVNAQENNFQQPPKEEEKPSNLGFVFGGKGGFYIPYNQTISEMYGSGFMYGLFLGYWGNRYAIELECKSYSKRGKPDTYGSVDNASSTLNLIPLTITGYWIPYSREHFCTYVGGGLGGCFINESLSMSALGQSASGETNLTGFEFHSTGGIRFKPFYVEINFSSVLVSEYKDLNFGGIILGFGLFF